MLNKILLLGPLAAFLALAPNANAGLSLTLSSGGFTGTGICGVDTCSFSGTVGHWTLNFTSGIFNGSNPIIDLSSQDGIHGSGTGANALTIKFSVNDIPGPTSGFVSAIGGTLGNGSSLTYQAFEDTNDVLGGDQIAIGSLLSFGPDGPYSGQVFGGVATNSAYGLDQVVVISGTGPFTGTSRAVSSLDASVDSVPEPASVVLLGGVLLGTVSAIRRKVRARRSVEVVL